MKRREDCTHRFGGIFRSVGHADNRADMAEYSNASGMVEYIGFIGEVLQKVQCNIYSTNAIEDIANDNRYT